MDYVTLRSNFSHTSMTLTLEQELLECYLPKGVFTWFEISFSEMTDTTMKLTLTEKNSPPQENLTAKGFKNITISDFPIRGRENLITFKRRVWVDEDGKTIKRDIPILFPGTRLEKEFALFLKEES